MPYNYLINWNDQLKKAHKNKIYMFVSENMFSFFGRERGGKGAVLGNWLKLITSTSRKRKLEK